MRVDLRIALFLLLVGCSGGDHENPTGAPGETPPEPVVEPVRPIVPPECGTLALEPVPAAEEGETDHYLIRSQALGILDEQPPSIAIRFHIYRALSTEGPWELYAEPPKTTAVVGPGFLIGEGQDRPTADAFRIHYFGLPENGEQTEPWLLRVGGQWLRRLERPDEETGRQWELWGDECFSDVLPPGKPRVLHHSFQVVGNPKEIPFVRITLSLAAGSQDWRYTDATLRVDAGDWSGVARPIEREGAFSSPGRHIVDVPWKERLELNVRGSADGETWSDESTLVFVHAEEGAGTVTLLEQVRTDLQVTRARVVASLDQIETETLPREQEQFRKWDQRVQEQASLVHTLVSVMKNLASWEMRRDQLRAERDQLDATFSRNSALLLGHWQDAWREELQGLHAIEAHHAARMAYIKKLREAHARVPPGMAPPERVALENEKHAERIAQEESTAEQDRQKRLQNAGEFLSRLAYATGDAELVLRVYDLRIANGLAIEERRGRALRFHGPEQVREQRRADLEVLAPERTGELEERPVPTVDEALAALRDG